LRQIFFLKKNKTKQNKTSNRLHIENAPRTSIVPETLETFNSMCDETLTSKTLLPPYQQSHPSEPPPREQRVRYEPPSRIKSTTQTPSKCTFSHRSIIPSLPSRLPGHLYRERRAAGIERWEGFGGCFCCSFSKNVLL